MNKNKNYQLKQSFDVKKNTNEKTKRKNKGKQIRNINFQMIINTN